MSMFGVTIAMSVFMEASKVVATKLETCDGRTGGHEENKIVLPRHRKCTSQHGRHSVELQNVCIQRRSRSHRNEAP